MGSSFFAEAVRGPISTPRAWLLRSSRCGWVDRGKSLSLIVLMVCSLPNHACESGLETQILKLEWAGNSNKDYRNQPSAAACVADQIRAGDRGIVGLMLESNLHEGRQDLSEEGNCGLTRGVSITDGCIGLDTTVDVLESLASAVKERRQGM